MDDATKIRELTRALSNVLPWLTHMDPGPGEVGESFRADIRDAQEVLRVCGVPHA